MKKTAPKNASKNRPSLKRTVRLLEPRELACVHGGDRTISNNEGGTNDNILKN